MKVPHTASLLYSHLHLKQNTLKECMVCPGGTRDHIFPGQRWYIWLVSRNPDTAPGCESREEKIHSLGILEFEESRVEDIKLEPTD